MPEAVRGPGMWVVMVCCAVALVPAVLVGLLGQYRLVSPLEKRLTQLEAQLTANQVDAVLEARSSAVKMAAGNLEIENLNATGGLDRLLTNLRTLFPDFLSLEVADENNQILAMMGDIALSQAGAKARIDAFSFGYAGKPVFMDDPQAGCFFLTHKHALSDGRWWFSRARFSRTPIECVVRASNSAGQAWLVPATSGGKPAGPTASQAGQPQMTQRTGLVVGQLSSAPGWMVTVAGGRSGLPLYCYSLLASIVTVLLASVAILWPGSPINPIHMNLAGSSGPAAATVVVAEPEVWKSAVQADPDTESSEARHCAEAEISSNLHGLSATMNHQDGAAPDVAEGPDDQLEPQAFGVLVDESIASEVSEIHTDETTEPRMAMAQAEPDDISQCVTPDEVGHDSGASVHTILDPAEFQELSTQGRHVLKLLPSATNEQSCAEAESADIIDLPIAVVEPAENHHEIAMEAAFLPTYLAEAEFRCDVMIPKPDPEEVPDELVWASEVQPPAVICRGVEDVETFPPDAAAELESDREPEKEYVLVGDPIPDTIEVSWMEPVEENEPERPGHPFATNR